MFITFRCTCARKLVVKQENVGKRCVCPECGNKSVVPEHSTEEPAARPAGVAKTAPAENPRNQITKRKSPLPAEEAPRKRSTLEQDEAPRKKRLTSDDEEETPRKRPSTAISDAPRKRAVAVVDANDEDEEEQEEDEAPRPRKKKKKSRQNAGGSNTMILVIALVSVGVLLLLSGGGFATWYFGFRSSGSSDQASSSSSKKDKDAKGGDKGNSPLGRGDRAVVLDEDIKKIPDDAVGFVTFDAAAGFADTAIGKQTLAHPQVQMLDGLLFQGLGMHLTDIRRVTLIVGPEAEKQIGVLISLRQAISAQTTSKLTGPEVPRAQFNGKSYARIEQGAVHIYPDNRTILIGTVEGVDWVATAPSASDKGALMEARKQAGRHQIFGAVNLNTPKIREGLQGAPKDIAQMCSNLLQARVATLFLDQGVVHIDLKMPNEKVAHDALDEAITLRTVGMKEFSKAKQQAVANRPPQMQKTFDQIESVLQSIKLTQVGDMVNLDLTVDPQLGAGLQDFAQMDFPFGGAMPGQNNQTSNDLKMIALAYNNYLGVNNLRPPQKPDDLMPFIENEAKGRTIDALKSGKYLFIWGVSVRDMPAGTANTVLAYEKDVPTMGGMVAMADGTVRKMTADEFRTATLAKRK